MDDFTRRAFVKGSAGAAAGVATWGVLAVGDAAADSAKHHPKRKHHPKQQHHTQAKPVVAYVRNHQTGEVALMSGDREWVVRDRQLAAQIVRHAR
ncbi:MAG: hypothetical protein JOZ07_11970 [Solirubrobacterales bacterium]|nr:hypothetical protein [Solirubrobacterales bacterium]